MDSLCQFAQSTRLNRIFSILKLSYCALGNSGLPREKLCGVYKYVRVLRRGIDALASLTDSELLTLYPELRRVAISVTALRQQRLKRIGEKNVLRCD
jgi:hypothetical protein